MAFYPTKPAAAQTVVNLGNRKLPMRNVVSLAARLAFFFVSLTNTDADDDN